MAVGDTDAAAATLLDAGTDGLATLLGADEASLLDAAEALSVLVAPPEELLLVLLQALRPSVMAARTAATANDRGFQPVRVSIRHLVLNCLTLQNLLAPENALARDGIRATHCKTPRQPEFPTTSPCSPSKPPYRRTRSFCAVPLDGSMCHYLTQ